MRELRWTNQAILTLVSLPGRERRALLDHLHLVAQFPAMYPTRRRGRFAGLRYFVLERRWLVYYRLEGEEPIHVFAIVPALARPR